MWSLGNVSPGVDGDCADATTAPRPTSAPARAARHAERLRSAVVITGSSSRMRGFPRTHLAARRVEQPLVVADANLCQRGGGQRRPQRGVVVVRLQVRGGRGGGDRVGAEQK